MDKGMDAWIWIKGKMDEGIDGWLKMNGWIKGYRWVYLLD